MCSQWLDNMCWHCELPFLTETSLNLIERNDTGLLRSPCASHTGGVNSGFDAYVGGHVRVVRSDFYQGNRYKNERSCR